MLDVIIIGGGPAGLRAALVLGRCRRSVLVCDAGQPRNAASRAMHGFISRDGTDAEFLRIAREQLKTNPNVEFRCIEITGAQAGDRQFTVRTGEGQSVHARMLLLAIGIVDELPKLNGIERYYGRTIHHCPYCDGW